MSHPAFRVELANPLPAALRHLELEFDHVLGVASNEVGRRPYLPVEQAPGLSRWKLLRHAVTNSWRDTQSSTPVLVLWPSLGYLEFFLRQSRSTCQVVIVHDPIPLRRQVGMGTVSKIIARSIRRPKVHAVVLSAEAHRDLRVLLPRLQISELPHPIGPYQGTNSRKPRVLLVAGQYKPSRDLQILRELAPALTAHGWHLRIVGRGWPAIPGWQIEDRFLSEQELDTELASASAVLLPYRHYYQSGIAVRAIEVGTVPIGVANAFLTNLLGSQASALPREMTPAEILRAVEELADVNVEKVHSDYCKNARTAWSSFIDLALAEPRP